MRYSSCTIQEILLENCIKILLWSARVTWNFETLEVCLHLQIAQNSGQQQPTVLINCRWTDLNYWDDTLTLQINSCTWQRRWTWWSPRWRSRSVFCWRRGSEFVLRTTGCSGPSASVATLRLSTLNYDRYGKPLNHFPSVHYINAKEALCNKNHLFFWGAK